MGCKVGKLRTKFLSSDSWTWIPGHSNPISRIAALVREAFDYSLMRDKFHHSSPGLAKCRQIWSHYLQNK
jgi:hypothetical protein